MKGVKSILLLSFHALFITFVARGQSDGCMIDDNWQKNYGKWEFSCERFDDPRGMIELLHTMGFKVMIWVCPFVASATPAYRELALDKKLMFSSPEKNQPAIVR